jgi:uncharacterized glyoxalase superfamily protein PhnB
LASRTAISKAKVVIRVDDPSQFRCHRRRRAQVDRAGPCSCVGDELRTYWDRLTDGGTVTMPMETQTWGDEFGMCQDTFGIAWMVNISRP